MSQENVEIVRDAFQTFGAEGIDAALSFFSPDFVWYPTDRWFEAPPTVDMTACEARSGLLRELR
jgi:ketosteroid isomerase-like protein